MSLSGVGTIAGGIAGGLLGRGTGEQQSDSRSTSFQQSSPVLIPRLPPVIPSISTGRSSISVNPQFGGPPLPQQTSAAAGPITIAGRFQNKPEVFAAGTSASAQLDEPWFDSLPAQYHGILTGASSFEEGVRAVNRLVNPQRYDELVRQEQQERFQPRSEEILTGLDIDVRPDPLIRQQREEVVAGLQTLREDVGRTITDARRIGKRVAAIPDVRVRTEDFDALRGEAAEQLASLEAQDSRLNQLSQRLDALENPFVNARTAPLVEERERARRDAARRGISGPLSALATNPFDTQIANERANAAKEVQDARLDIENERLQIQQQREVIRQGSLRVTAEQFQQDEARFQAALNRGLAGAEIQRVVGSAQQVVQSILSDISGEAQAALQQELFLLGIGQDMAQLIINSQLAQTTAQQSFGTSGSESEGFTRGDLLGDIGRGGLAGNQLFGEGGFFGG